MDDFWLAYTYILAIGNLFEQKIGFKTPSFKDCLVLKCRSRRDRELPRLAYGLVENLRLFR